LENLKTSIIQTDLYWEDADANLAMLEEKIWQIGEQTDLIVLPEMFSTGFSMKAEKLAEPMNFKTFKWMSQMARQKNAAICGSYIVKESTNFYNRLYFVEPDGRFSFYDKRHLFRMGEEHNTYTQGKTRLVHNFRGWKIMPMICYDLRFPVWIKNHHEQNTDEFEYDLLIFVANWPAPRTYNWETLLKARSMENQCYTVGVNRTGSDGEGIEYSGNSVVVDFKGQLLNNVSDQPAIETIELNLPALDAFRKKFPAYKDWDQFNIDV
jgi:predicted amidohydrolase